MHLWIGIFHCRWVMGTDGPHRNEDLFFMWLLLAIKYKGNTRERTHWGEWGCAFSISRTPPAGWRTCWVQGLPCLLISVLTCRKRCQVWGVCGMQGIAQAMLTCSMTLNKTHPLRIFVKKKKKKWLLKRLPALKSYESFKLDLNVSYHHCHVLGIVLNLSIHDLIFSTLQPFWVYTLIIISQIRILYPREVTWLDLWFSYKEA